MLRPNEKAGDAREEQHATAKFGGRSAKHEPKARGNANDFGANPSEFPAEKLAGSEADKLVVSHRFIVAARDGQQKPLARPAAACGETTATNG
jgi:hypothetical protein